MMALAVLTIAGTILSGIARRSFQRAVDAGAAQEGLQLRWATISLQALFIPAAEELLDAAAMKLGQPVAFTDHALRLGGLDFHLAICDEQAKANVNMLAKLRGDRAVPSCLSALQSGLGDPLPIIPRPDDVPKRPGGPAVPVLYGSFQQLFELDHPAKLFERGTYRPGAAGRITCWGGGKVNFRRAEPVVLREVLEGSLTASDLANLLDFRRLKPEGTLGELIRHLNLPDRRTQAALELLTDSSSCHGLWIIAQGPTRKWHRFYVVQTGGPEAGSQQWVFQW